MRYGDIYYQNENSIRTVLEENGAEYYDFEHLNVDGADAFSKGFAQFLVLRAEGADLSKLFVSREEFEKRHYEYFEEFVGK